MNEPDNRLNAIDEKSQDAKSIKVWDIPIRIFHWLLVLLFVAAYVTNSLGTDYFKYHLWCGYAVIVLVIFRIVWGLVGTYHAKFINFIRSPVTTIKYAIATVRNKEKHYAGHNPLGALMVIVLLLTILIQALTGLFTNDEILNVGPLYGYITDELSLKLTSLHRHLFYWILGAIALHIVAVLVHVFFKRDNIIKAMLTGKKPSKGIEGEKSINSSKILLAIIVLIILIAILAWIVIHAPEATSTLEY